MCYKTIIHAAYIFLINSAVSVLIYLLIYTINIQFVYSQSTKAGTTEEIIEINKTGSYYIEPGSYGTKRESDPPDYIRNLSNLGFSSTKSVNWINIGLDTRERWEWRHNDIRRPESFSDDYPLLLRQRLYIGLIKVLDPFRFALEIEDARRNNGIYQLDNRDVNTMELIQGYAELYFEDILGRDKLNNNRPLSLRFGRMAFEFLDRRLIGLNQWRNTTNNFTGFKLSLGQDKNDWQIDALVLKPIIRDIERFDETDDNILFTSLIGHWRSRSDIVTIEPYYMGLKQNAADQNNNRERDIHGLGLRLYGWIGSSGINYDLTGMYQFGTDNQQNQRAYSYTTEIGYTIKSIKLLPRFSLFFGYVSGDKDPNDKINNRFERFYGFARPWSSDDYVIMENIVTPKVKIEFQAKLFDLNFKFDGGYSFYWLASKTDRFNNLLAGNSINRDRTGQSGDELGHGLDFRTRFNPLSFISTNIGYTHFTNGEFVRNRQLAANNASSESTDFVYIELSLNIFDLIKQ